MIAYGEHRRHRPGVADLPVDEISLQCGSDAGLPGSEPEHLSSATTIHAERSVELGLRIGDGDGVGIERSKEHLTLVCATLVHEDDVGGAVAMLGSSIGELA